MRLSKILLLCCLCFPVAGYARPVILVFGDSLSAGYGLAAHQAWPDLLQQRLENTAVSRQHWQVINASISGETTAGGLIRLPSALTAHHPAVVILELGANDGLRGLPLGAMQNNLASMIRDIRKTGARILLVGVHLPPNYGISYIEKFRQVYTSLAQQKGVSLVPSLLSGIETKPELFQADDLHPIAAAENTVLANIWPHLVPLLKRVESK